MARTVLTENSWTSFGEMTVDTVFGVEGGANARFYTLTSDADVSGVAFNWGHLVAEGTAYVVPKGVFVWAVGHGNGATVTDNKFGV